MNCRDALEKLYDYLDQEITPEIKQQIDSHINHCGHCFEHYKHETEFHEFVKAKLADQPNIDALKSRIRGEIAKIDRAAGLTTGGRNILYLLLPIAAAAVLALFIIQPFSTRGTLLEQVYPYAMEHNKCIDHVMQYIVRSHNPQEVKAALAHIGALPEDLFRLPNSTFQLAGAGIAHVGDRDRAHLEFDYLGKGVSVFVLEPGAIDKTPFDRMESDGKSFWTGSCPKFQYVIWNCEGAECVAVSQLDKHKLMEFASVF